MGRRQHRAPERKTGRITRLPALLAALSLAAALGGCSDLLDVEAPGLVDPTDLEKPENADLLVSGTIADFECALGAYVVNSGLLGNELRDGSFTAARFPLDQRVINSSSPYGENSCAGSPAGIYRPLSTAIWTSGNALTRLQGWTDAEVPNRTALIAQAAAYSGYSHVLMAEGFCSAVITENGPEVQPPEILQAAVGRFDTAIEAAQAAGNDDILNMGRLGRARARLNLGDNVEAAADARAVLASSPEYVKNATASSVETRRYNRLGAELFARLSTVDPAYRDLTVGGEPDERTAVINDSVLAVDQEQYIVVPAKYGTALAADLRNSPIPIATWREARLIIAEAEGGQEAEDQINALRSFWQLPPYAGGTDAEIQQQVIVERSRELFLEGHHLNDLRRFDLPLLPSPGADYRQGGSYGSVRCFPLPDVERDNNANIP
jgi:hypothetical protein